MAVSDDEVLTRLGIRSAEPFNWGDQIIDYTSELSTKNNNDYGPLSVLDSIKLYVQDDENNSNEKRILRKLLGDADISTPVLNSMMNQTVMEDKLRDISIKGLSDRAAAELNIESRASLFGSILRLFDMPDTSAGAEDITMAFTDDDAHVTEVVDDTMIMKEPILSTAEIIRSVHLTARPGDIPSGMDSKEYTLSVLHFISSNIPYLHENEEEYRDGVGSQEGWDQLRRTLPVLPLIKAINPTESLELRCYGRVRPLVKLGQKDRKQYPESMDTDELFRQKVLNLERIYCSSLPFSSPATSAMSKVQYSSSAGLGNDIPFAFQRYLPRRKVVPHIVGGNKEELTLMISGHMQQPHHTPGPKRAKVVSAKAPTVSSGVINTNTMSLNPALSIDEMHI
jgi:hypothetical protein